jgi:hypothetical protein
MLQFYNFLADLCENCSLGKEKKYSPATEELAVHRAVASPKLTT